MHETGTALPRGLPVVGRDDAARLLGGLLGEVVHLGRRVRVLGPPETCPACGGTSLLWGCADDQDRDLEEIHPLARHETELLADSYFCRDCDAGWVEPDDPEPITWVRPYWL